MLRRHKQSDADLVRQVLAGRREDFGELVERHLPAAFAVAYGRTGNHADAEDATQEAFLRALKTLDRLREPAKFGSWLLTIARNVATDTLIARTRERNSGTPTPNEDDASWLPNMEQREMWSKLHEQIRQLDSEPREVLLLFYFAGKPTKEIAALLNLTHDAVRKRLQRAREILGTRMLEELQPERKLEPVFKKHCATVTAAALAAPVAWQTASAATVPVGAGLALGKGFAATVLVLVAGLTAFVGLNRAREEALIPSPQPEPVYDELLSDVPIPEPVANREDHPDNRSVHTDADVALASSTPSTDVIRGRVEDDETGEGIEVAVELTGEIVEKRPITANADEERGFLIDVSNCGYGSFTVSLKDSERYIAASIQGKRRPGEPVSEVVLRVREMATISGYVFRTDGSPVPRASIMRHELGPRVDTKVSADERGHYIVYHDGGNITLAARQGELWSDYRTFKLSKTESVTHDFVLPESGEIHLVLQTSDGAAIESVHESVLMTKAKTSPYLIAERVAENEFVARDLPFDTYSIAVCVEGYDPSEITGVWISGENPRASIHTLLNRSALYDVTLRVLDAELRPLQAASVILNRKFERTNALGNVQAIFESQVGRNGRKTDANGEWSGAVPAGSYRAFSINDAGRGETHFTIPDELKVTIQLESPEQINFRLEIVDGLDGNKPLNTADAYLLIVHAGNVASRLGAGTNHIVVVKEGYTAYLDTIVVDDPSASEPTTIRAVLGTGGTIEGVFHGPDGLPEARHQLLVFPELLWRMSSEWSGSWVELGLTLAQNTVTKNDGTFTINHLPEGRYIVTRDRIMASDPIDVVPGMVTGPVEIVAD